MKKVFIIHGAYGSPEENWFPWLQGNLENCEYEVVVPMFPTPVGQNLDAWMEIMEPYVKDFDEETVLVGHSVGGTFLLSVLEKLHVQVSKTILGSSFMSQLGEQEFDEINETFLEKDFNWETILNNSKQFVMFQGDDDPYVSKEKSQELAVKLSVDVTMIKHGGHLNTDGGFLEFPKLLEAISI